MLSVETGNFGFVDMYNTKMMGTKKLVCELTLKDGKVVYDLNGISADMWDAAKHSADESQSRRWTTFNERPFGATAGAEVPCVYPGWSGSSYAQALDRLNAAASFRPSGASDM